MQDSAVGDGSLRTPSRAQIAGYASGNFAKNILWHSAEVSVLYIFTDLLGYNAALAGSLLLLSLVWDAVLDPAVGMAADKTRSRFGRYGPYILLGGPLAAIFFVLLFSLPLLPEAPVLASALILLGFRAAYSLIDLPHNALIASISQDSRKRTEIASARFFFSSLASLLLALALPAILTGEDKGDVEVRFAVYAAMAAALSCLIIIASWTTVARFDRHVPRRQDTNSTYRPALAHACKNGPFVIILIAGSLASLTTPMFSKGVIYLSKYIWTDVALSGPALMAMVAGQFISLPLWTVASSRFEKTQSLAAAHGVVAMAFLGPLLSSLMFENVLTPPFLIGLAFVAGTGAGGIYALIWSLLPDAIDDGEYRLGARHEGAQFGLLIFGMKAASAIGTWALAFALDVAGYVPETEQSGIVKLTMLATIYGAPVVGSIICALLLSRCRITHERHEKTVAALR